MRIIQLFLILLASHFVIGQHSDFIVIKEDNLTESKIRWMPTTYYTWQSGIEHGYTIVKLTETENGTIRDTLVTGLKPLPANQWDSSFPNNDAAKSAKLMLYNMTYNTAPAQINNLKDAIDTREQVEGRHLFAMVAAESDFEVSKAMALGLVDDEGGSNVSPTYVITISNEEAMENRSMGVTSIAYKVTDLEPVGNLESEIDENYAVLAWDTKELATTYTAWNIERSMDGVHFTKINQDPFRHGYTSDSHEFLASYQDPIQECEGEYFYRVVGVTPFGTEGPPSLTSKVNCVKRIKVPLYINGSQEKDGGILVNWWSFDNTYQDSIQGFNLYRTPELTKQLIKLNGSLMSPESREYLDKSPLSSGYYFLEAIDNNNHPHRSNEFFVQVYDKVPPTAPIGLVGEFYDPQQLTVTWTPNSEDDIYGYNISVANQRNGQFIKWNAEYLKRPIHTVNFNKNFITDSVFVKVTALDNFYNPSEYSEILAVARPDVFGPADPILEFAYPTPEGVALGWSYSGSDDVVKHKLQRRVKNQYDWKDLLIISKENESKFDQSIPVAVSDSKANHIDKHDQKAQEYHYRLIAIDDAGNVSPSEWLTVTPFPTAEIVEIKNFKVAILEQELAADPQLTAQLTNMGSNNLHDQLDAAKKTICSASISWTCKLNETIAGFILYRSMTGSSFKPIKEMSIAEVMGLENNDIDLYGDIGNQQLGYEDKDLKKGYRYSYYVVAKYRNGAESGRSQVITNRL